jgi:hypothetical protein
MAFSSPGAAGVADGRPVGASVPRANVTIPDDPVPPRFARSTTSEDPLPTFQVLRKREEAPTEKSPLTYREYVYAVAPGTSEEAAARLIRDRFREVERALANVRPGKLVNLAVFDHIFRDKPQRAPLVTLAWKDWKSKEPEVRHPTREGPGHTPTPLASSASTAPSGPPRPSEPAMRSEPVARAEPAIRAEPVRADPAPRPEPVRVEPALRPEPLARAEPVPSPEPIVRAEAPIRSEPPPSEPRTLRRLELQLEVEPVEPVEQAEPPAPAEPLEEPPPAPRVTVEAAPPPPPPPSPAPAARPFASERPVGMEPVPSIVPSGPRLSGDDLLVELFEAFSDLHFLRDSLEGADFVLGLTLEKLPSEVGIVSLFDINNREFVVVRQAGGPRSILLQRLSERAPIQDAAMKTRRAIVVAQAQGVDEAADPRWLSMGVEVRSLICAPVEVAGRYLGLIELINPLDENEFTNGDGHALTYIGQQLAEFVSARGIIIDPELVLDHAKRSGR